MTYQAFPAHPLAAPPPLQGSILQIPTHEIYTTSSKPSSKGAKTVRLVQSIKKYGLPTPLVVTPSEVLPGTYRYLILEGEELWRAACLANLPQIPCRIASAPPQEGEIAKIFAQIGAKTADMFEQAVLFRHLTDSYGLTQEEISRRAGLSQSAIANKLRLLHLTATEQKQILLHGLSERHARAILRLKTPELRLSALSIICQKNLSVAATEALVESFLSPETAISPPKEDKSTDLLPSKPCLANAEEAEQRRTAKFVLHTLKPLYNSLERTLNIFRKTGRNAFLDSVQSENGLLITITIPNP